MSAGSASCKTEYKFLIEAYRHMYNMNIWYTTESDTDQELCLYQLLHFTQHLHNHAQNGLPDCFFLSS